MKILITGGYGMLGRTLRRRLAEQGHEIAIADLPEWDVTDTDSFSAKLVALHPDVVIHCAAMTKVDDCETNRELAFKLNEEGSRNVALACKMCGARLFAVSTDYVFSGDRVSYIRWQNSEPRKAHRSRSSTTSEATRQAAIRLRTRLHFF